MSYTAQRLSWTHSDGQEDKKIGQQRQEMDTYLSGTPLPALETRLGVATVFT